MRITIIDGKSFFCTHNRRLNAEAQVSARFVALALDTSPSTVNAIKLIHAAFDCGLAEAKDMTAMVLTAIELRAFL